MSGNNPQKVALVIGAPRAIGRQMAIDLARAGYIVVLAAKSLTDESKPYTFPPDPNSSPSTITTVAPETTESGDTALAILADIDVIIYNSRAIHWSALDTTPTSRFCLLLAIIPVFRKQGIGRAVVVCPPIYSRFFHKKTAYAVGKMGMSAMIKGLAMDWERRGEKGLGICGVWPVVFSATGKADPKQLRDASIFGDALIALINSPVKTISELLDTDEYFLRKIVPAGLPDLTVGEQDDEGDLIESAQESAEKL
ncbi:hypothetical protein HOY80DRAFT_1013330 [Tuber brumale]|nr:hypothetical protein HOY80DRAFT_1013330 [Tuber brumale]